jgi:Fe2+ transport system protein B
MRGTLITVLFFPYYIILGIICYSYFKFIKKEMKEKWHLYVFFYGMRIRLGVSGILAVITADLILYGYVRI